VRVRIAPGTRCPCSSPGRAASLYLAGSRFDSGRGLSMGNGVTAIPQALEALRCASESRFPSSRLRSSSGQSVSSVRRRSPVRIGPEAPSDRSVSGQHVTLPRLQRRFESGRSLVVHAALDQSGRSHCAQTAGCAGSSPAGGTEGEPDRVPGSPAKRCAGNTVSFDCSAFRFWEMKSLGGGPRVESGWGSEGLEIRVLRLPPWRVNLSGRRPGFENRWARRRWRS
jgi:hypothetical protein